MNDFLRGMATIGNLQPSIEPLKNPPTVWSSWADMGASFAQVGKNIRTAMDGQAQPPVNASNQERRAP
ncbi:hypothetical protein FACS189493_1460 [Spirochaetia bacterium]|nr:hypothetical protein FACS189493_1460 [Spirochaetia bacterium]